MSRGYWQSSTPGAAVSLWRRFDLKTAIRLRKYGRCFSSPLGNQTRPLGISQKGATMARGGKRLGAGRKPHTRRERWLGGNAGKRSLALVSMRPEPLSPAEDRSDVPDVLTAEEAAYWRLWFPVAQQRGLLTVGTVPGFVLLCQWAQKAAFFWQCIEARGVEQERVTIDGAGQEHREYKANGLLARWSDAMKRVEQLQARYGLAADGKVAHGYYRSADAEDEELARLLAIK